MPLIKCPNCGRDISDKAKKCIGCGYVLAMNTYSSNVIKNIDSNQAIAPQPIVPADAQQRDITIPDVVQTTSEDNTVSSEQKNDSELTQEKIMAFTKLMQDGIITPNELTKILSCLSNNTAVQPQEENKAEKTGGQTNNIIRIAIDRGIDVSSRGAYVKVVDSTGKTLGQAVAGSVIEIHSDVDIPGCVVKTLTSLPYCTVTLSPKNGGRYKASWGVGLFGAVITNCVPVDSINSF